MDLTRKQMLGGIAGILATGAAPAIMRMPLGARGMAFAPATGGGGTPTARSYVQDGLIAMWDGIENAGWGVHDASAKTWVDLSGNGYDLTLLSGVSVIDNGVATNGLTCCDEYMWLNPIVCELACNIEGYSEAQGVVVSFSRNKYLYYAGGWIWIDGTSESPRLGISNNNLLGSNSISIDWNLYDVFMAAQSIKIDGPSDYWFVADRLSISGNYNEIINNRSVIGTYYNIRLYSRSLTDAERLHNYNVDNQRFGV